MSETVKLFLVVLLFSTFYFFLTFNPIESVLWLMLTCALFAFLLLLFNLPFFAGSLIILYVSAVTVLFIYVILMLPSRKFSMSDNTYFLIYFVFFALLLLCIFPYIYKDIEFAFAPTRYDLKWVSNYPFVTLEEIGLYLFTDGSLIFVILTLIFFTTLIGLFLLK